jgi:bilirubin oxidase
LIGYDGMFPGPTIVVPRGTESVVRFMNRGDRPNSVHIHGSPSRAPFDGWTEDITEVGQYKDYYYGNSQSARLIWYHDHAMHNVSFLDASWPGSLSNGFKTSINAYMGQAGGYVVTDPAEDALGLPSGYGEFDIPLILSSSTYKSNGSRLSPPIRAYLKPLSRSIQCTWQWPNVTKSFSTSPTLLAVY